MQRSQLNFKGLIIFLFFCWYGVTAQAQVKNYKQQMELLHQSIRQHFFIDSSGFYKETAEPEKDGRPVSFLWPLCALLQADNEMELLGKPDLLQPDFIIIEKYHNTFPPAPGYASYAMALGGGSRFYDDNQWIGITAMDAFKRTRQTQWLATGKEIYRFIMSAYDTLTGGGLYWQEDNKKSKNTCSNGPGIILALQLYQATKQQAYLDTALLLYNWVNANLRSPSGLYYDNIKTDNYRVDKKEYSYNTGTMLQANVYLYECTHDKKYLRQATAIADSSVGFFVANKHFKDDYWFSAVLLRAYQHLLKYNPDKKYILAFKDCIDAALDTNKNDDGLMGKQHALNLVAQGGMLEMLGRFAWLQQQKIL
ncbi:glycoside hydrolase family 76 protein [Ferruginibacter paludis]|uniref:glycoside hydrolase family 76 protein n=1 Tax=Ferruginibacter paludis TaxID=1310417 RepID=UPI0025B46BD6|nr:glycoside hydrolase family 76 protein [Ferruginibacter paludis]MDN3654479.1 glycoside hydrolase family 76 protein [Ferruginibacter paludis]